MTARTTRIFGRLAFGFSVAAVAWSAALVVGAFAVPIYSTVSSDGATSADATLVGANGLWAAGVAAVPLLVAAVVWWALRRTCTRPGTRARGLAWTLAVLLLVFCVLTGLSIGIFVLPVAFALCCACVLTPDPATATA